jgi:RNA polymerase sigma-70 factor (ECF subfamily)
VTLLERALDHLPSLLRVARRLTRSEAAAEDLVQDTLVRAIEKQHDVDHPERLRAWLLAVERTVFLNSVRGRAHALEVLEGGRDAVAKHEPSGNLEDEILARSLDPRLDAALDALPAEQRDALWLREVEELSYEEIAKVQGCAVGTVRSRLARARQTLVSAHEADDDAAKETA